MKKKYILPIFIFCLFFGNLVQAQGMKDFYRDSANYIIRNISVNTNYSDLYAWPLKDDSTIIFMSNRENPRFGTFVNRRDAVTEERFYALYSAKRKNGDSVNYTNAEPYHSELKARYNSGPVTLSRDGKTMVLTRNVLKKKQADKRKDEGHYRFILQLFQYTYNETKGKWENEIAFPYNSNSYSCAHAFLSSDGNYLYFCSDMPGGYGGMDIYICGKEGNSWGKPQNMGKIINSSYNEIFPTLSKDDKQLYFSTNREGGMGGLDIYSCTAERGKATEIVNMGYPINSVGDDFGLIFYKTDEEGYFSSDRLLFGQKISKGKDSLNDNIYFVKSLKSTYRILIVDSLTKTPLVTQTDLMRGLDKQKFLSYQSGNDPYSVLLKPSERHLAVINVPLFGTFHANFTADPIERDIIIPIPLHPRIDGVVGDDNGLAIANADIVIRSSSGKQYTLKTDAIGNFSSPLLCADETYTVVGSSTKFYAPDSAIVIIPRNPNELKPVYEVQLILRAHERMVLAAEVLFDLDKYNIRPDAKKILDTLVPKLKNNPTIEIRLEGHTDSRASYSYNIRLSERRANSVKKYLVGHGISDKRITTEGYSYSRLVNRCKPKVWCAEEEHQQNRRVEFLFTRPEEK